MKIPLLIVILAGALGGCAGIERQDALDTEKLLAEAGFQMRPADDAEPRQALAHMPPARMIVDREGARTVYTYVDTQNCRCAYVGDAKAYDEYRRLALSEAIARDMNAEYMNPDLVMTWGVWDAWSPRLDPDASGYPLNDSGNPL
jgi:hypothetical protein